MTALHLAFNVLFDINGKSIRTVRCFNDDTELKTEACWSALYNTTDEQQLLELAGGNKWIVRRAIEMYKLGVASSIWWNTKRVKVHTEGLKLWTIK